MFISQYLKEHNSNRWKANIREKESCPSEAQHNRLVTVGFSMHKLPQCCV